MRINLFEEFKRGRAKKNISPVAARKTMEQARNLAKQIQWSAKVHTFSLHLYLKSTQKSRVVTTPQYGDCISVSRGYLLAEALGQTKAYMENLKKAATIFNRAATSDETLSPDEITGATLFRDKLRLLRFMRRENVLLSPTIKVGQGRTLSEVTALLAVHEGAAFLEVGTRNHAMAISKSMGEDEVFYYGFMDPHAGWFAFSSADALSRFLKEYFQRFGASYRLNPENPGLMISNFSGNRMVAETGVGKPLTTPIGTQKIPRPTYRFRRFSTAASIPARQNPLHPQHG
ncbi:MAG: hypothetical protein MI742_01075 [Desulfobacterales bacterium]|nr:hypothetical protein [Desulfobacterales bacterium]